jgi:hypothetical protein
MADANPSGVNIRVVRFYSKDVLKKVDGKETGELTTEDWVEYGPPGAIDRTCTPEAIRRLARAREPGPDDSQVMRMGWDLWQTIKPQYETWKRGEELPIEGTPLSAWTGARREHVEVFKKHGLRTVEEIAGMNDAMMTRVQLPGLRELKMQAQRFLAASDQNKVAAQLKNKDDQIAALAANQEAMQEQIRALLGQKPEESVKARVAENEEMMTGLQVIHDRDPRAEHMHYTADQPPYAAPKRKPGRPPNVQKGRLVQPEPVQEEDAA